jgi:archaellum component FlaF (FlaF/FlaG flagellin family)
LAATWCSPDFSYHSSQALQDLYQTYGPNGSDEVMVLLIECDTQTDDACLYGVGGNTVGDWVSGTPYPIVNDSTTSWMNSVASLYQLSYYPTIFGICPDGQGGGTVYEVGQASTVSLASFSDVTCGQALSGVNEHASLHDGDFRICSTTGDVALDFTNYGNDTITSGVINLLEDGNIIGTENYVGSVVPYETGTVTFSGVTVNMAGVYTAEIVELNGNLPSSFTSIPANVDFQIAELTGYAITVDFFTDNYPSESSWQILDGGNNVVASGGPYTPGTDDQWGAGGPDALTTISSNVVLPFGVDCYTIRIMDSWGDGLQYGTNPAGQFGIKITSMGNEIINWDPGAWGSTQIDYFKAIKTDGTSSLTEQVSLELNLSPNPASDFVSIEFDGEDALTMIHDMQGRLVMTQSVSSGDKTDVGDIPSGIYMVKIITKNGSQSERLIIE